MKSTLILVAWFGIAAAAPRKLVVRQEENTGINTDVLAAALSGLTFDGTEDTVSAL